MLQLYTSESKPNGFTKKCRDCGKLIYLHRGSSDRWRAFEPPVRLVARSSPRRPTWTPS